MADPPVRLGVLTIGQSPRDDMIPDIRRWLSGELVEAGALDGLTAGEVAALAPSPADEVLVTRLSDGRTVTVASEPVHERLQERIDELEATGVTATLIVCTGAFRPFRHTRPLLSAERLLRSGVAGLVGDSPLGVLCPEESQTDRTRAKWRHLGVKLLPAAASPYLEPAKVGPAAATLARAGAGIVVLDCMGYTQRMKDDARRQSGVPVVLARSLVARIAGELLC